jgi:transposase InsO family protein
MPHQTLHARMNAVPGEERRRTPIPEDESLVTMVHLIKQNHPTWGIRRVRALVRKQSGMRIGRKRITHIMRTHALLCSRIQKRVHRSISPRITATRINQLWATDMTQFILTNGTKVFLIVVMDVFTRRIIGWHANLRCRAIEWLRALDQAFQAEFPEGVRGMDLTLRMDNGCQPTSRLYQDTLTTCGITGEWVGFNCPEQNAHVESLIGTLKRDWLWLEECPTFSDAHILCQKAVHEYNTVHPHSSLGMWSPNEFKELVLKGLVSVQNNVLDIHTKAA